MFRRGFLVPAAERAVKGAVIGLLLVIVDGAKDALTRGAFDAFSADWGDAAGYAVGGAVISLCLSVMSYKAGPAGSPSLVRDVAAAQPVGDPIVRLADHDARKADPRT